MATNRVTIKEIADELGVSTATVSNVIHGKTKKISNQTVSKVQEKLEESGYIPNMAAVLLAQNSSRIVCVVLSDDVKYEGRMLEDPFVAGIINGLSKELSKEDYFMMLKEERDITKIAQYASMWNMAGLILIGYCFMDYENLRKQMHIPFVVVDSYEKNVHNFSDVGIDNIHGGYKAGSYLIQHGHTDIVYLSDNDEGCDHDRYIGLQKAKKEHQILSAKDDFFLLSMKKEERRLDYQRLYEKRADYTAAFCASDVYAIELMNYFQEKSVSIPEDFSIIGFDDIPLAQNVHPKLTTIRQDLALRAKTAVELLEALIQDETSACTKLLPVTLIERESVK